jgi:putative transposase
MPKASLVNKKRWKSSNTSLFNCAYHIIFCPKYRKKVLTGDVELLLKQLLLEKAEAMGWQIEQLEVMPDHVHLFLRATPSDAPHNIVGQLKGYSSFKLRQKFPELQRRMGTLWTRSYYIETVGCISEDTIQRYILNQKQTARQQRNSSND